MEKRLLQAAIILGCVVPISGGLLGLTQGTGMLGQTADAAFDSHFRYLSGLLLGIGLAYISAVPKIESQGPRVSLLTAIVVVGGFARLFGMLVIGWPGHAMVAALAMELAVVPLLWLWQRRVAAADA